MELTQTIEILEALASGCSPLTGEFVENDSVLHERNVIRALEKAISELEKIKDSNNIPVTSEKKAQIQLDKEEIQEAIDLFLSVNYSPSYNRLTHFFLKTKVFEFPLINSNKLYGKYHGIYQKQDLNGYLMKYLTENGFTLQGKIKKSRDDQWMLIDFFDKETFNKLTEKGINQLKDKINNIGIEKTENLSDYIINARKSYPRAYESWSDEEKELLSKALNYTNDLNLLSECFQRGPGSISNCGRKIIYEQKPVANKL